MFKRQNSRGSVNVFLHMNTDDNIQVVPSTGIGTCNPQHTDGFMTHIPCSMDQHSTIDFNQIPLTVTPDFFTVDSNEEKDIDSETEPGTVGQEVYTAQRWSPGPNTDARTVVKDFQFNAGNNFELQAATHQALQTGTIMPLVKEELKCSIQSKRLKEGKNEMVVSFEEPKPDILSPEEEEKVELRRTQNREAARRFRDKQKRKTDQLEKECRRLEAENSTLRSEKSKLKRERDDLSVQLQQHLTICTLQGATHPGFYTNTT